MNNNPLNKKPIFADFNACDEDGSIVLNAKGTIDDLEEMNIEFSEGQTIWITDGEIEEIGTLAFRNGVWVAVPVAGTLKDVDENAPYHVKNQK